MNTVSIDDFLNVSLRTGRVQSAEPVPDSKKLLRLTVDIGGEVRQIVAGIAPYVAAEELVGQECVVVVNLEPKTLAGVESQGMLLAAVAEDGSFALARCPGAAVGTRVR